MSMLASQRCTPVIGTVCVCHRGVSIIGDQPVETLVGEEADVLPFRTRHIGTARIEVAQQQDVLSSKCNGSVCHIPSSRIIMACASQV